jgi:hypothetical protein
LVNYKNLGKKLKMYSSAEAMFSNFLMLDKLKLTDKLMNSLDFDMIANLIAKDNNLFSNNNNFGNNNKNGESSTNNKQSNDHQIFNNHSIHSNASSKKHNSIKNNGLVKINLFGINKLV